MMTKRFHLLKFLPAWLALLPVLLASGCKKDDLEISDVPEISIVSVSPTTVTALEDSIVVRLHYRDGNGDLGENDANAENLFIKDNRINQTEPYRIPQLAPDNADIIIDGNLDVVIKSTGITNGSASQTVTFTIWVTDRAGNKSNEVTTQAITVVQ